MGSRPATEEDPDEAFVVGTAAASGGALPGGFGIGDDTALLDHGELVTTDTMVEGVHWDDRLSPADVGWKLVAVNVSDVGAMGGRPRWATLALSLPSPLDRPWVEAFFAGLGEALREWGVVLVGGDTTRSPGPRVATLTVGGVALHPIRRSGARVGDELWVTGKLGRSAEAFFATNPRPAALAWFRRPHPPVRFGAALGEAQLASAMLDVSDGLARDLGRLCRASGVAAEVDPAALPSDRPLAEAVAFGEDYELLFAAAPEAAGAICSLANMSGIPVTRIGHILEGAGPRLRGGASWPAPRFDHFPEASR